MIRTQSIRTRGFTLIELLVVISIIALLIALLLPALGKARETSITIQCLHRQKGLGVGFHNYISDFKALPGMNYFTYGFGETAYDWRTTGPHYATTINLWNVEVNSNIPTGGEAFPVGIGAVGIYLTSGASYKSVDGKVFHCPGNPKSVGGSGSNWYELYYQGQGYGCKIGDPDAADPSWPFAIGTYAYRGGDFAINKTLALNDPNWATNWMTNSIAPSPDHPALSGQAIVTDWWFSNLYTIPSPGAIANKPHNGRVNNSLWFDGSANTYTFTANHPVALNTWYDGTAMVQSAFNPLDFYNQQPFWWAVNDYYAKPGGG